MTMYDRTTSDEARFVGEWEDAFSWIAHPDEEAARTSHAIATAAGVWLLDPLDYPGLDDRLDQLGGVTGVAVLSSYHARDAGVIARRHGVAVHVPAWMNRIEDLVDAPIARYTVAPGGPEMESGFHAIHCRPFPAWQEAFLYHEPSATLVVADSLGTCGVHCIEGERLGLSVLRRLQPPAQLRGLEPDRILVGHGGPVSEDATAALQDALYAARWTFPDALVENGSDGLRAVLKAIAE